MENSDKTLNCRDCGQEFAFTIGEQKFYEEKGFENEPARCPECRTARKRDKGSSTSNRGARPLVDVVCDGCGKETQVPFKPRLGKPVFCRECFEVNNEKTALVNE